MRIDVNSDNNGCGCAAALLLVVIAAVVALLTGCRPAYTEGMPRGMAKVDGHVYLLRHDNVDSWVHDPQCPACQINKNTVVYEME